jgi:hypothetical protein
MRTLNWPKLVFIFVPLLIVTVSAALIVHERLQPNARRAIALVKESNSRKENFTLQQYLYATVYHARDNGEGVTIGGWRAESLPEPGTPFIVDFTYSDSSGKHIATWKVDLKDETVIPKDQAALNLSWH